MRSRKLWRRETDYEGTSVANTISVEKDVHVLLYWFYYKYYYNRSILQIIFTI